MISIKEIAQMLEGLYANVETTEECNIQIFTELKKFYGDYGKIPNGIIANIQEIATTPIGVDGIESYQSAYGIEMLVPENLIEVNKQIWKSIQMEYQGKLVDYSFYNFVNDYSAYSVKIAFENYNESSIATRSNGNVKSVSLVCRVNVDQNIVNANDHHFALVVNNTEYAIPITRYEIGEVKNTRAGNFGTNGRIGAIAQSQSFSATLYCVLRKGTFWQNVVLPILLNFQNYEGTLKIAIDGTSYVVSGNTDNRVSVPVIINILNYNGNANEGVICAISCIYRG